MTLTQKITPLERALLRLLVLGYSLPDAAPSVGLSVLEAEATLHEMQCRHSVSGTSRLLALAILKAWV